MSSALSTRRTSSSNRTPLVLRSTEPTNAILSVDELERSVLRHDLEWFVRSAWPLVEPTNSLKWNWHLSEFCSVLSACKEGSIKRLIVNVPPGTSKSLFFSVFFNAWVWAENPSSRFLTFSYSDANTIRDNLRLRDIVRSEWYRRAFWTDPPIGLSSDQSAKVRFNTTATGWRIASSVGGTGTGEHPNYIIIDDPLKAEDARSPTMRAACQDWMSSTVSTRQALDPTIIVVMQRLHEDDLTGFLLAKGGWEHLCFPMSYDTEPSDKHDLRNVPDPRDHRTVQGELLWPEVWTKEKVEDEELLLGLSASGQLQQRPVPEGGTLFQREWFEIVDSIPLPPHVSSKLQSDPYDDLDLCRGWDIAETDENEAGAQNRDWTVGVKMGRSRTSGLLYILDVVRERKTLVDDLIKTTAKQDGIKCKVREGSGSGKATIKARSVMLAGYDFEPSPETTKEGDKIKRSNSFRSYCQRGNVKVLRAPWNDVYLSVICSFPAGKFDDDVDASANAFNCLVVVEPVKAFEITW